MEETYTSQEIIDMANSAPSNTMEEDIEGLANKEITKLQIEYRDEFEHLLSDEFAENFHRIMHGQEHVEQLFEAHLNKNIQELQNKFDQEKGAIHELEDYRKDNYHNSL